jgi:uncharacterized membrane protein YhaH (DUF805 family)
MSFTQLLLSFHGRIPRLYWWVGTLVVGGVAGILSSGLEYWAEAAGHGAVNPETDTFEPSGWFALAIFVVGASNVWISYALSAKRLHDRGRSAWWLLPQFLLIFLSLTVAFLGLGMAEEDQTRVFAVAAILGIPGLLLSLWLFVELGFLKGTVGPNRYGRDPLGAPQEDAAP